MKINIYKMRSYIFKKIMSEYGNSYCDCCCYFWNFQLFTFLHLELQATGFHYSIHLSSSIVRYSFYPILLRRLIYYYFTLSQADLFHQFSQKLTLGKDRIREYLCSYKCNKLNNVAEVFRPPFFPSK